jgi:hypothetical protein
LGESPAQYVASQSVGTLFARSGNELKGCR